MVRLPAKPISAPGSASVMSPCRAKLAATPPIVGLVRMEMYSPPAGSYRARAADTLAICISDRMPSCIRAPPPEPLTKISGSCSSVASSDGAGQLLADDRAHAAGHEGEVGDAEDDRPAADEALADHGGVGHAGLGLLVDEPLVIRDAVHESERVARLQVGEPLLEAVLVEQLRDAVAGRAA